MITRREALVLLGSATATAVLLPSFPASAQPAVPQEELAAPGPLGDVALGPADAKVTIVEYASLTCGHCAATITKAVQAGIPGAVVDADPGSKTVRVSGTTDLAAVRVLIAGAGYTPTEAAQA